MSVQPINILLLAERLLKDENSPEGLRAAVSRAYYAAFHEAKLLIESAGAYVSGGLGGHGEVRNHFSGLPDADDEGIGNDLSTLHGVRIIAGYKLKDKNIESIAQAQVYVKLANQVFSRIGSIKSLTTKRDQVLALLKMNNARLRTGPPTQEKKT